MTTVATTITPPSTYALGVPQIHVEIWPHNGGKYVFNGSTSGILSAEISKNIRDKEGGKFVLQLAPGGPNGVDDPISWTTVLTPCSLVVISLARSGSARTVMMGVITEIEESQTWDNKVVSRTIRITGMDFTYYFSAFSYYQLTYQALIANQPEISAAGYLLGQAGKNIFGTPATVASYWYNHVMLGTAASTAPTAQAVLQNTYITYQGKQIFLWQLFSAWFEEFVELNLIYIPVYADLLNAEGTWLDKFLAFLPFPYYEFFVTTANNTDYPSSSTPTTTISETGFNTVWPTVVARINPLPWVDFPNPSGPSVVSRTRWDSLPTYSLGNFSFIESMVNYNTNEVCNFLGITTLFTDQLAATQGNADANLFGFEVFGGIIDRASMANYGFRPIFSSVRWMAGPPSIATPSSGNINIAEISNVLLGKLASYYIPTPNMLSGDMVIPMWPDILPGNKFIGQPFKNNLDYEFYIEGVTHIYNFGGKSATVLNLARGLKKSDYDNDTTLIGLHTDAYTPIDGVISPRPNSNINASAYYTSPTTVLNLPAGVSPYYAAPPNIRINTSPAAPAEGWPPGITDAYDSNFQAAANACPGMDWRNLKAQAIAESSVNQSKVSSKGAVGIMQIIPADYPMYNAAQLEADPAYNIMAGGQIMCGLLNTYGSWDLALAHYIGGTNPNFGNPTIVSYISTVNRYALAAGAPNIG